MSCMQMNTTGNESTGKVADNEDSKVRKPASSGKHIQPREMVAVIVGMKSYYRLSKWGSR